MTEIKNMECVIASNNKGKKDSIKIADLNLAIKEQFQDYILISTLSYNTLNNLRTSLLRVKPIYDDKPF